MSVLIIAEAGVNHNGDIELAKLLIDAAAASGSDIVKFQTFSADKLVTRDALKASYQIKNFPNTTTQHSMLRQLELTHDMHLAIIEHCADKNIQFLSTGFDIESIDYLYELGQRLFKIPSGEITNLPLLRHVGRMNCQLILSTGMANLSDIEAAIDAIETAGSDRSNISLLHCTTEYPAPVEEVNLRAMQTMQAAFNLPIGYSDHTSGLEIPIAAVAMGAQIIEKHFTIKRNLPGPDHLASIEPDELRSMVLAIRKVELALGNGNKKPSKSELKNRLVVRKSIVASRPILKGDIFTEYNIAIKRPGNGISPMQIDDILGRNAHRNYDVDDLIEL